MKLRREDLDIMPVLSCWTSGNWADWNEGEAVNLPPYDVFQGDLSLLADLVAYGRGERTALPEYHHRLLQLVCVADVLGVEEFMSFAANELDIPVNAIRSDHPLREVRQVIRGWYRTHRANTKKYTNRICCGVCHKPMTAKTPRKASWVETSSWKRFIHHECYVNKSVCCICGEALHVLPCAMSKRHFAKR